MTRKLFLVLLLIGSFLSCESESQIVSESDKIIKAPQGIETTNEVADLFIDSIKTIKYKEFELIFTRFNKDFNLWYLPRLIVDTDTLLIEGLSNENGSELSISKSPNENFFVLDNIIKGYVEDDSGNKSLYENYTCVLVNVKEAKVEQSLQSECDGSWNSKNEWVCGGYIVFAPK